MYKISSSSVRRYLKKEINKAYEYHQNNKKGIYYGTLYLMNVPEKGEVYFFEVSHEKQYDFFGTIWGVTYISGMPIFLVGEENHRYVKPMNKKRHITWSVLTLMV